MAALTPASPFGKEALPIRRWRMGRRFWWKFCGEQMFARIGDQQITGSHSLIAAPKHFFEFIVTGDGAKLPQSACVGREDTGEVMGSGTQSRRRRARCASLKAPSSSLCPSWALSRSAPFVAPFRAAISGGSRKRPWSSLSTIHFPERHGAS